MNDKKEDESKKLFILDLPKIQIVEKTEEAAFNMMLLLMIPTSPTLH